MLSAKQIAEQFGGQVIGDENIRISSIKSIKDADTGCLAYVSEFKYYYFLKNTKASIVLVPLDEDLPNSPATLIKVKNPAFVFAMVLQKWVEENKTKRKGIKKSAIISKTAKIGKNVFIGDNVVIDDNVIIGDNAEIFGNTYIAENTQIGENVLIYPNVSIYSDTIIGNNCIIHSGVVIGSDGFGFLFDKGEHLKVPQIGNVKIGNNVEIGANTTIDRATVGQTTIADGTKIDNLVQVAHNVEIGKHCILCAQVGIAGSTTIGDFVTIAGQVGINGHINIGNNVNIAAKSGVTKSIKPNEIISGFPATNHKDANHLTVLKRKLPEIYETVQYLKNELKILKNKQ